MSAGERVIEYAVRKLEYQKEPATDSAIKWTIEQMSEDEFRAALTPPVRIDDREARKEV